MKDKIIALIGPDRAAHVEKKAATRGIADIWKRGEESARAALRAESLSASAHLTPEEREQLVVAIPDEKIARLAATRAQQIAGVIPRFLTPAPAAGNSADAAPAEGASEAPAVAGGPEASDAVVDESPKTGRKKATKAPSTEDPQS